MKNQTIRTYESFNARRFSNPWIAQVDENGKINFSSKVGAYTGRYSAGSAGDLFVYEPVEGRVYAFGQKDTRGNRGGVEYAIYKDGQFMLIAPTQLLAALRGEL